MIDFLFNVLKLTSIFCSGSLISAVIVSNIIKRYYRIEEELPYEKLYYEDFDLMEHRELTDEDKETLIKTFVEEETPEGTIVMCYNYHSESYHYWCDKKNIKFLTLDTVAQKYALDNDCKEVCVNYKDEFERAKEDLLKILEESKEEKETSNTNTKEEPKKDTKKSVFAEFKSYNKNKTSGTEAKLKRGRKQINKRNVSKNMILPENCNRFSYRGTIDEWKEFTKTKEEKESETKVKNISFSQFKQMNQQTNEKKKTD